MDVDSPRPTPPRSPAPARKDSNTDVPRAATPASSAPSSETVVPVTETSVVNGSVANGAAAPKTPPLPKAPVTPPPATSALPAAPVTPTPAEPSTQSTDMDLEEPEQPDHHEHDGTSCSSSGASIGPASAASGDTTVDIIERNTDRESSSEDMDRFLRRVEMEKKMANLQQRLELASIKTNHGWSDMSIREIETRLPDERTPRPQVLVPRGGSGNPAYEPPSPTRPWQLADVLWQPLPPPGGAPRGHPNRPPVHPYHAPSQSLPGGLPSFATLNGGRGPPQASPRRQRMDDYLNNGGGASGSAGPKLAPLRGQGGVGHGRGPHTLNGSSSSGGHRRASNSVGSLNFLHADPYPGSPLRPKQQKAPKKRSQSHSNLRDRPTTQDVDAARALTFMLESGRSPVQQSAERFDHGGRQPYNGPTLPPIHAATLPPPFSPEMPPPRPRSQSFAVPELHSSPHSSQHQRPMLPPLPGPPPRMPTHTRRGQSMDSSAAFRAQTSTWQRNSNGANGYDGVEREREAQRERERDMRERERARDEQRERERAHERDLQRRSSRVEEEEEGMAGRGEDDATAVELMMFLASSPSPARKRSSADVPLSSFGGTARVLFADGEAPPAPRPGPPSLGAGRRLGGVERA